jgi:hypothetical protein
MTTKKVLIWVLASLCTLSISSCNKSSSNNNIKSDATKETEDWISGNWLWNSDNGNDGFFNLSLSLAGKKVTGSYSAGYGGRIDDMDGEISIEGTMKGDVTTVNFTSGFFGATGKAEIKYLSSNEIEWKITQADGEHFFPNKAILKRSEANNEIQIDDSQINKVLGTWNIIPEQDEMGYGLPSITFNKDGSGDYTISDDYSAKGKYTVKDNKIYFTGVGIGMDGSEDPVKETFTIKNNTLTTKDGSILKQIK